MTKALAEKKSQELFVLYSFPDLKAWGFYICKTHVNLGLCPVL